MTFSEAAPFLFSSIFFTLIVACLAIWISVGKDEEREEREKKREERVARLEEEASFMRLQIDQLKHENIEKDDRIARLEREGLMKDERIANLEVELADKQRQIAELRRQMRPGTIQ